MCTFLRSLKMATSLGAVREDEEMGRADPRRQRGSLCLFMACVRRNRENCPNGEKSKCVYFCYLMRDWRIQARRVA